MEVNFWLISLPALIALTLKGGIYAYAHFSKTHNFHTRLYLLALFGFSLQNIAEIAHFYTFIQRGIIPTFEVNVFYGATVAAFAFLFHLALALVFGQQHKTTRSLAAAIYLYAGALEIMLFFTPWLIQGYTPIRQYTVTRIPGPLYPAFEFYAFGVCLSLVAILAHGVRRHTSAHKRNRVKIVLMAVLPLTLVLMTVLAALHLGVRVFNAAVTMPIAIAFFLVVTAYATHQYRLFDIQFYIPWSKVRKRKTAFYDRIRAMIAEIVDLGSGSIAQALQRVADTLRCPAALVGGPAPILAGSAQAMADVPLTLLRGVDQIVVANEIEDTRPEMYRVMKQHGVAAIVPFYPHNQNAASWLLLGDSFSDEVYTPLDFRMVEQLFDKMAELFLDKLLAMRSQLADAHGQINTLERRMQDMERALTTVQDQMALLTQENTRLRREQPIDSLLAPHDALAPITVTLLGRDKALLGGLRQRFPQAENYAAANSASFRRKTPPDLLIALLDGNEQAERQLLTALTDTHRSCAMVLYGPNAGLFAHHYRRELTGALIEVLPRDFTSEALQRKVLALIELRRSLHSTDDADYPLLGQSLIYRELMAETGRVAGFRDPVFIKAADTEESIALGRHIHARSNSKGKFVVLRADADGTDGETLKTLLREADGGSLMIGNVNALPDELWEQLRAHSNQFAKTRLIVAGTAGNNGPVSRLKPLHVLVLELPPLCERRSDIPLFVHYFTLQFNLQGGVHKYLTQSEVDDWLARDFPRDLHALKAGVYALLSAKDAAHRVAPPEVEIDSIDRTLDECVGDFEARLIEQTLKRCNGNKSKAARLLGLRPNTLHYKIERYGIHEEKKRGE
jgi:hypothetical protein